MFFYSNFDLSALYDILTPEELSNREYISERLLERVNRFMGKSLSYSLLKLKA